MKQFNLNRNVAAAASGLAAAALLLIAIGCGGGGGGDAVAPLSPIVPGDSRAASIGVYLTDGFRDDYSHVWMTLNRIELAAGDGVFRPVFDDAAGIVINVPSLASSARLLARADLPAGRYTKARLTFDDHMTLTHAGGAEGGAATIDDKVGVHGNGHTTIIVVVATAAAPGQEASVALDLDLPAFTFAGGKVSPRIHRADDSHFGQRPKEAEISGTVSDLTPGVSFRLTSPRGGAITVRLSTNTTLFSRHSGAAATLANGARVEVRGAITNATSPAVDARTVRIEDGAQQNPREGAEAEGKVASVDPDPAAQTLRLAVTEAKGVQPATGNLLIRTDTNTIIVRRTNVGSGRRESESGGGHGGEAEGGDDHGGHDGGAAMFSDITIGATIEVDGTMDAAGRALTARRIEIR